ncbi:PFL_4669 family integrating conjugative element protein [Photobacterium leiognathi]|uniref:PFL_4669 family integrating conjugative element protein n=1 Tax=Photobacterium leiognathi TaxID=553611 RepID=UPI0029814934|nr:TIGR03761 family integrating conjugative element protein [Photobacterium leiognathi]
MAKNNLGALYSNATILLHANASMKLWYGVKGKVVSIPACFNKTAELELAASHDDPYADHALIKIENALNDAFIELNILSTSILADNNRRRRVNTTQCQSMKPVEKSLFVKSRFGWRLVALLEEFDLFMVDLMDAQFKARVTRHDFELKRTRALTVFRHVLTVCHASKRSGITRQDIREGNAKAEVAKTKFGRIPMEVAEGVVRAEFAPEVKHYQEPVKG